MSYVSGPVKRTGHKLDVYKQSARQEEMLGTKWVWDTGEVFRYAYARSALTAGYMCVATGIDANIVNEAATTAYTTGTKLITQTITAPTYAIPEDGLRGGKLVVNDEYGEGYSYPIVANKAVSTTDTSISVCIGVGLKKKFIASTTEITYVPSPWGGAGVIPAAGSLAFSVGVPLIDVSAGYYCWLQTGGIVSVLHDASLAADGGTYKVGVVAAVSQRTAGAIGTSLQSAAADTKGNQILGTQLVTGVSTEYNPIYLTID